jgi:hypothetical protein
MNDTSETTEAQPKPTPPAALVALEMRGRAIAARLKSDRLWDEVKAAESEMLPAKRKYEKAVSDWSEARKVTVALEMAAEAMEEAR